MGPPAPKRHVAKRQPAISRFFAARPQNESLGPASSTAGKRKTAAFSGPPSKRAPPPMPEASGPSGFATEHPDTPDRPPQPASNTPETALEGAGGKAGAPAEQPQTRARWGARNRPAAPKLTPLEQQFRDLKSRHTEKVLAIQVGYKYKFFGQDAVVAAQLLNIMLVPGNIALDERTHERYAYCLVPDVRLHIHLQRLLNHGLKVGVVKQTETAAERGADGPGKSAVFLRLISAVYTKATYMGDEDVGGGRADKTPGLGPQAARYIVCIDELQHPAQTGVVAVQPATGDIVYDVFRDSQLRDQLETRLAYLNPSEVLVVGLHAAVSKDTAVALRLHCPDASVHGFARRPDGAVQTGLDAFFGGLGAPGSHAHVSEFYLLHFAACVQSCVLQLAEHLAEFRLSNVFTITSNVAPFAAAGRYMVLPAATLRALDVFEVHDDAAARRGSLVWLLDRTHTRPGARMLRHWIGRPLVDKAQIEKRLQAVACLACGKFVHVLDAFKAAVAKLGRGGVDLDRLLIKVHYLATYKNGRVSRKDVYLMLKCFGDLLQLFRNFGDAGVDELGLAFADSELLTEIMQSLLRASGQKTVDRMLAQINAHAALNDRDPVEQKTGFFVHQHNKKYAAISEELARIADIEAALDTELQALRRSMNRPRLAYVTNMKETHLIEVRNGKMADALPPDWLRISATKTVARFRTPEVSRLHKQLQYHNERLLKENDNCFNLFLQEIDAEYVYFRQIVHDVARFDCLLSLSTLAQDEGHTPYVRPQLTTEQTVDIRLGCHPILLRLPQNSGAYVPNDVQMAPDKNKVLIITGPNMGGKSSLVKQIALFVIMTQVGCFLPCAQATMGIFDSIYIRMGASDNILRGKSTFMVEMLECASIVQNYTPNSLIILDEIGRGTGTSDGIALAYSILKYIIEDKNGPLTLFITHYPSLHVLEQEHETVANHHMAFVEKHSLDGAENDWPEVVFLYKLVAGVVSNLYGLNVAKLAGIEKGVIDLAHQMSQAMKADVERGEVLGKLGSLRADNAFDVLFNLF